jgi:DNA-binding PadR family transcriptional regulator
MSKPTDEYRRRQTKQAEAMLEEHERQGLIRWTGAVNKNGRKVYQPTAKGQAWATAQLWTSSHDRDS